MQTESAGVEVRTKSPKELGIGSLSVEVSMPEAPGASKSRKYRGAVYIDWSRCKGCGFCIEFCPPKVLAFSEEFNTHGYHPPYLAQEAGCTGCDLCGLYCPDFAIFGVRVLVDQQRPNAVAASLCSDGAAGDLQEKSNRES